MTLVTEKKLSMAFWCPEGLPEADAVREKKIFMCYNFRTTQTKEWTSAHVAEGKEQITTLPSLGGRPGVKPPVGAASASPVDRVGLGEGIGALRPSGKFITFSGIQVPPFGLS